MKKILGLIFLIAKLTVSASEATVKEYSFPYKDPYTATIVGSSTLMISGISSEIDIEDFTLDLKENSEIPESLWYQNGFKFSLVKQKDRAPLIFLIAGTGAAHNSTRMSYFQRIFYDAGYNVLSITSPVNTNFILNASESKMPGLLAKDSRDIYEVMYKAYDKVKSKVDVSDFYLVGYSLGASQAAYISYLDEKDKYFDFKRVYMMNPTVDMHKSGVKLDKLLDDNINGDKRNIGKMIDEVFTLISKSNHGGSVELSESKIYGLFTNKIVSEEKMKSLIGLAFRLASIDVNYVTDLANGTNIYVKEKVPKYGSQFKYFEAVDFANFNDYLNNVAEPYYETKGVSRKELLEGVKLDIIEEYLKNSKKIAVMTNEDDLILDGEDLKFLKDTFKDRIVIFPSGGHSGNMYYGPNVKMMLTFLGSGVLKYEE